MGDLGSSEPSSPRRISRIMEEGVFHSNGGVDEYDNDEESWCDFGTILPRSKMLSTTLSKIKRERYL